MLQSFSWRRNLWVLTNRLIPSWIMFVFGFCIRSCRIALVSWIFSVWQGVERVHWLSVSPSFWILRKTLYILIFAQSMNRVHGRLRMILRGSWIMSAATVCSYTMNSNMLQRLIRMVMRKTIKTVWSLFGSYLIRVLSINAHHSGRFVMYLSHWLIWCASMLFVRWKL